ncbi:hypothetical protein [Arthrobacter zhaoguopingii]|uniref:hypothetical protein n=1 Tax=Arthrobacter zhaoguopingii TaxID=2681491 RepID=UPI001356A067|nr:hypothetical protein [Arthrobacter zhaoguopingii]
MGLAAGGLAAAAWLLDPGPLGRTHDSGAGVCMPKQAEGYAAAGQILLANSSRHPVTLEKVELQEPQGLDLVEAHLLMVPEGAGATFGAGSTVPPDDQHRRWWDAAEPAVGGEIPAGATGNLILAVSDGAGGGGVTDGARITYSTGFRSYTLTYDFGITLAAGACS